MTPLHEQFIVEARELIQEATEDLIALERGELAAERIDRVFRAFHTLKGSAGVVQLPAMALTLHAAEDLLAAIQTGRLGATAVTIDLALACLDQVTDWIDAFEARGALPDGADEDARAMTERLRAALPKLASEQQAQAHAAGLGRPDALPDWVSRLFQSQRETIVRHIEAAPTELFALSYEPRADCFFTGDDPLQLMRQTNLLALEIEPREPWPPLAELDPFACNLRFKAIAAGNRADISNVFRLVPDQVRIFPFPATALGATEAARPDDPAALVRAVLAEQGRVLRAATTAEDLPGRVGAAARVATNSLRHMRRVDLAEAVETASAEALACADAAPLLSAIDATLESLPPKKQNGTGGPRPMAAPPANKIRDADRPAAGSLRIDQARVDALVNLAGELAVAKNGFAHLARRAEEELGSHELARAVRREYEALERLAGEMHSATLQLRMVPVGQVFRSLPRLVRDMAQKLGKNVALVTRGETTESDRTVVDRLFEPLLHLVRNALDHGIEDPETRRAAGKSQTATLLIDASRAGDRLVVQVEDDGRGIDSAIIRRRAEQRGVLSAEELAGLSDQEVIDVIFAPGFSTAAETSEISGRGVGMDIVRTTIEQIGGRVAVRSQVGIGTTMRLDLPTNISMSRIMVVEAGQQVFGIPMDAVSETVRLNPDRITHIKQNDGFVLRNRVVPICSLAELMNLPVRPRGSSDMRLLVVTEATGKIAALEVDAIRDRLEVVLKPMQGLLSNARGYAGTTLLGDGRVLLVLDLKEILP